MIRKKNAWLGLWVVGCSLIALSIVMMGCVGSHRGSQLIAASIEDSAKPGRNIDDWLKDAQKMNLTIIDDPELRRVSVILSEFERRLTTTTFRKYTIEYDLQRTITDLTFEDQFTGL